MSPFLKAVASFTETAWLPVESSSGAYSPPPYPYEVLWHWNEDETVEGCGLGFEDLTTAVEWQEVDRSTMAYRIAGKVLLVVGWEYDGAPDGAGYTITEWTMGTEAQQ